MRELVLASDWRRSRETWWRRLEIVWKPCTATERDNTAFGSMTNGVCASFGVKGTHTMSRSWIIARSLHG
jgi:hypothetical protein